MIPLVWFLYYAFVKTVGKFIPWLGKRLSRDVQRRVTTEAGHGIEFEAAAVSVPDDPQPAGVRIACSFRNRSRAAGEIVGADLRVGRTPTAGTIHRLRWEDEPPFDFPVDLYFAPEATLWLDGTIRLRSEQSVGSRRVGIGEHEYGFSHEAVVIEGSFTEDDHERFAAACELLARRFG